MSNFVLLLLAIAIGVGAIWTGVSYLRERSRNPKGF